MKKGIFFICFVLTLGLTECKSQQQNSGENYFSIKTDSLSCGDGNFVFTTQYIKFNHPDDSVFENVNKGLQFLLKDIYTTEERVNLKETNKKCCENFGSCDLYIQEYQISFQNSEMASLSFRNYMYGFTPGDFNTSVNFDLHTGKILHVDDVFSEEGLAYIKTDMNRTIISAIKEEKKTMTEEELLQVDDIFNDYSWDEKYLHNFVLLCKNEQYYIRFLFSFGEADFQTSLLPVIDLKYSIEKLKPYLRQKFISALE